MVAGQDRWGPRGHSRPIGDAGLSIPARGGFRAIAAIILTALMLSGCVHAGAGGACCEGAERYPRWMIDAYEPVAPVLGSAFGQVVLRRGLLATKMDALEYIESQLRPLDILVVSSKGRLTGNLIPGLFSHTVVYLGSESQLKAMGAWNDPAVRRHQAAISAGKVMIESDHRGVHLTTAAIALDTDRVVVLRPRVGRQKRIAALLISHVGTPYDFVFDNGDTDELYCAELIDHAMPDIRLPSRVIYGRRMFLPDDAIAAGTGGRMRAAPVLYVRATLSGWEDAGTAELKRDLAAAWSR